MTDFRTLNQPHDLRSQLGLKNSGMTDERRISLGLPPLNEQNQESLRAEIADALRRDVKPLSPDEATPDPLHKIIAVTGCTNQAQARRIHEWFEGKRPPIGTSNVVVNVTNNGEQRMDQNTSEIVASIRKMIDSPDVSTLRQIGQMREHAETSARIDAAAGILGIGINETQVLLDVRAIARLIPEGALLIKGVTVNEYLDAHEGDVQVIVKGEDVTAAKEMTTDVASVLRGVGIYATGGFITGPAAPTHRALSKIHDHVESLESDILEALVMAGANPHADRRRLDAARTQFEMAFMMLKKAVDPEQERE